MSTAVEGWLATAVVSPNTGSAPPSSVGPKATQASMQATDATQASGGWDITTSVSWMLSAAIWVTIVSVGLMMVEFVKPVQVRSL